MLTELRIRGLGVIDEAVLDLEKGLTVVTGETGAGKTMVVTGLGLVTGARADSSVVRNHEGTAAAEARFTDLDPGVAAAVSRAGGVVEGGELLVARHLSSAGRSRAWLGGAQVPVATLQELDLVTIHGQSEQIRLSSPDRQREVLDRAAGPELAKTLGRYSSLFGERKAVVTELTALTTTALERAREADMLRFGLEEIERVSPQAGEDDDLVEEAKRLQDADQLRGQVMQAVVALAGDESMSEADQSAMDAVGLARKALHAVARTDPLAEPLAALADELSSGLTELAGQASSYLADLVADPIRLEWVEDRLAQLKGLTRKYGANATDVLEWARSAATRLATFQGSDERIAVLEARAQELDAELAELADTLSQLRRAAADDYGRQISAELADLAMPQARVDFAVTPLADLGPWGKDHVQLLFTANAGSEPAPLGKVASGGELSRVRLAIETVLAEPDSGTTFVFDEVDAGIGGAVGLQVGLRLARLARRGQVIVVTHLAQVAAFADQQWVVVKQSDGEVTSSGLNKVEHQDRLAELARMMGGLDQTSSSLAHARELVEQAQAMVNEAGAERAA